MVNMLVLHVIVKDTRKLLRITFSVGTGNTVNCLNRTSL